MTGLGLSLARPPVVGSINRIAFEPADPDDPTLSLDGLDDLFPDQRDDGDPTLAVGPLSEFFEPQQIAPAPANTEPSTEQSVAKPAPALVFSRPEKSVTPEFPAPAPRIVDKPQPPPVVRIRESFAPELAANASSAVVEPPPNAVVEPTVEVVVARTSRQQQDPSFWVPINADAASIDSLDLPERSDSTLTVDLLQDLFVADAVDRSALQNNQPLPEVVMSEDALATKIADAPIHTSKRRQELSEFQLMAIEFRSFAEQFHAFAADCKPGS